MTDDDGCLSSRLLAVFVFHAYVSSTPFRLIHPKELSTVGAIRLSIGRKERRLLAQLLCRQQQTDFVFSFRWHHCDGINDLETSSDSWSNARHSITLARSQSRFRESSDIFLRFDRCPPVDDWKPKLITVAKSFSLSFLFVGNHSGNQANSRISVSKVFHFIYSYFVGCNQ